MKSHTRKMVGVLVGLFVLVLAAGVFVWSGLYNIGADDPHFRATYTVLETLRDRSIATRASQLDVPDLSDRARIKQGAGNYNAMCTGCHLSPGVMDSELSKGLYPAPPNLAKERVEPAHAFWVIKHGIKASGMPAWGKSMGDEYIWNMTAFLQKLPDLDAPQYRDLVAHSGGHSHGGGEIGQHEHSHSEGEEHSHDESGHGHDHGVSPPDDDGDDHAEHSHDEENSSSEPDADHDASGNHDHSTGGTRAAAAATGVAMRTHRHADGTIESHPVKPADAVDDGHTHQH